MAEKNIYSWLEKKREEIKLEVISWGFVEGTEDFSYTLKEQVEGLDKLVLFVKECVETKELEKTKELFSYFENLSHNRRIAFLFTAFTGIPVGQTNKSGIKAFVEYFGSDIPDGIVADFKKQKEVEKKAIETEKEAKNKEQLEYFNHPLWDKEKVANLTAMQFGRVRKVLDTLWRFDGKVESLRDNLVSMDIQSKKMTSNMYKWNSKRYDKMSCWEQDEYEAKLKKGRTTVICYDDDYTRDIPKTVFNLLALDDTTNFEKLAA